MALKGPTNLKGLSGYTSDCGAVLQVSTIFRFFFQSLHSPGPPFSSMNAGAKRSEQHRNVGCARRAQHSPVHRPRTPTGEAVTGTVTGTVTGCHRDSLWQSEKKPV